ncbi:hypothetical protein ACO0LD_03125 [Undibacterium sp. Ji83W]|uniref:hypothetical protein n=1 Tax=Undibacterium sp. Ji83W TaxID=3413043 RepID=UPI003BF1E4EB
MSTAENTPPQDDLSKIIPTVKTIIIAGESLPIQPFKVGRLPLVLTAVQPIAYVLMGNAQGSKLDMLNLVIAHTDDSLNLLSVLANKPRDWVDGLDIDDAVTLLTALLEVNIDFFIQRVLPRLLQTIGTLSTAVKDNAQALTAIGQTASNPSSQQATA